MPRFLACFVLLLAGCASNASSGAAPSASADVSAGPVTLSPGQKVDLPRGGYLRYVETTGDSRCRPGRQCVWAGEATVVMELSPSGTATQRVEIKTSAQPPEVVFKELGIRLVSLSFDEPPKVTLKVDAH